MSLRWLWFDHIPPELEVPTEARSIARSRAKRHYNKDWNRFGGRRPRFVLLMAGLIPLVALWVYIVVKTAFRLAYWPALSLWIFLFFAFWVHKYFQQPFTRFALCHLGYLCCVKCAYPHTGLSKDVKECPECGAAREFGKCIHCNSPQEWAMGADDKCTQCGRLRLS